VANSISIELELDDSGAIKKINGLEQTAKKAGKKAADNIEDPIDRAFSNINKSVKGTTAIFAGLGAATLVFARSIQAAQIQEQAVSRLNQQLSITGELSKSSSQDLQDYAASLQKISEFGDELIIEQIALAKSFGATNEQAKQIASTAIDLSKSFGISLESATRNAARTLGGFAGELGEVIPELKNLTAEQLRAGEGINLLQNRFNGAGKNINDFSFVTSQASNAFGDLLEELGKFATQNQSFIGAIKSSISFANDFAAGLTGIREGLLGIKAPPVDELESLDRQIEKNIDKVNLLRETLTSRSGTISGFVLGFSEDDAVRIQGRIDSLDASIKKQLAQRKELVNKTIESNKLLEDQETSQTQRRLTDAQLLAQAGVKTESILTQAALARFGALEELKERKLISEQDFNERQIQIKSDFEQQLADLETARAERQIEQSGSVADAVALSLRQQQASFVDLGKTITKISVQGFGNAFRNIGKALAEGASASEAFTNTVKGTIGDLANAFGDFYIAKGIALSADPTLPGSGAGLIAAGAALKVLSGLLGGTATSGAGGGAQAVQDVGGSSVETGSVATAEPQQEEQTTNQIIVQGDVFDSEETGLRIFDIISQQSEKNGNVIIGGAFA